jgi:hypothetical protein
MITPESIVLTSNMRDENTIPEWIAYHTLIGFDYILIYDHLSNPPISTILEKYNFTNVQVVRGEVENMLKPVMMNTLLDILKTAKAGWTIHLDADEYFTMNRDYESVRELVEDVGKRTDILPIPWIHFGTNYHSVTPPTGLVIEHFTRSTAAIPEGTIKSLLRVSKAKSYPHPHFCTMTPDTRAVTLHNTPWKISPFNKGRYGIDEKVTITHYTFQSYEEYVRRKVKRRRDDMHTFRQPMTEEQLHKMLSKIHF